MTESEKLFDYYYSAKQAASFGRMCNKVRGLDYTEAVETGGVPTSNFDDLICIARGVSIQECSFIKKPLPTMTGYQSPTYLNRSFNFNNLRDY
jgi:hypothetical protein